MYIQNGVLAIILKIKDFIRSFLSLRAHLIIAFLLLGIVPAIIVSGIMFRVYTTHSIDDKLSKLQTYSKDLADKIVTTGYLSNPGGGVDVNAEIALLANQYDGRVIILNQSLVIIEDTFNREEGKVLISSEAIRTLKGVRQLIKDKKTKRAEILQPITVVESGDNIGVIIINLSLKDEYLVLGSMQQQVFVYMLMVGIILFIFVFYYSRSLVQPLKSLSLDIRHVSEGYLEEELKVGGYTEVKQITDSINEMIQRLRALEDSRQEFVSNVSHELKTPITSVKVLAESLLAQNDAPIEMYREFLGDINEEIERENDIITDLLSLVKMDKKTGEMHIALVSINELLEIILKRLKPIAKKRNIELVMESFRSVMAEIDEVKLSLAVSNLIENAVKYNVDNGWVKVSLDADHRYFYINVSDSGIGIPQASQSRIFDRFYRVDKARSRQTGGTGLGLSITKNVVLMHNGGIKVSSEEGKGSTFTIRIPLNYIP